MRLVTAAEMRDLDRATIEGGHASGPELMRRAGLGVADAIERHYGPALGFRVLVLCGLGNNGGDGFVAARELARRGAEVHVAILGDRAKVTGDAATHLAALEGGPVACASVREVAELERLIHSRDAWDMALDALLGTGARGVPEGLVAEGVQALRDLDDAGTRVIAVDLPTGANADTGDIARRTVRADLTVTFGCPKRGHYLYPARAFVGALEVVDIGLVSGAGTGTGVELACAGAMAERIPRREPRAHKRSVGCVLVVGGSRGLTGAVALAARAATRAGAGYVIAAVPRGLNDILEVKLTEEMTAPVVQTDSSALGLGALPDIESRARGADAVALGPGLSRDPESAELARRIAASVAKPMVVDADALNAFAGRSTELSRAPEGAARILTPHVGEMARLTGLEGAAIEQRRIDVAREWAARWNAIVVLKGAPTVTAHPDGRVTVNPTGNPGLATAGTGDVLTGTIAALVAQGLDAYDAARLGAFVHGAAGDRIAQTIGQHGMCAGDVAEALPHALRELKMRRDEALEKKGHFERPA